MISASVTSSGKVPASARGDLVPALAQLGRYGLHAERLVDLLFASRPRRPCYRGKASLVEGQVPLGCDFAQPREMRIRPGRKQQRDAVMRGVSEMCGQLSAGPDGFGSAWKLRHFGDKREVADEFAAAAEVSSRRDADDIGHRLLSGEPQRILKARRAVHMALAVGFAAHSEPMQDFGLKRLAKSFDLLQPRFTRGLFQFL